MRRAGAWSRSWNCSRSLHQKRGDLASQMSGGQQQMLALGRGLIAGPDVLLLDEPTLGLAPIVVSEVFQKVSEISDRLNTTILVVEHNIKGVLDIVDRAYRAGQGEGRARRHSAIGQGHRHTHPGLPGAVLGRREWRGVRVEAPTRDAPTSISSLLSAQSSQLGLHLGEARFGGLGPHPLSLSPRPLRLSPHPLRLGPRPLRLDKGFGCLGASFGLRPVQQPFAGGGVVEAQATVVPAQVETQNRAVSPDHAARLTGQLDATVLAVHEAARPIRGSP